MIVCFGLQLACAAFFWNRYIEAYRQLIEFPNGSKDHAVKFAHISKFFFKLILLIYRLGTSKRSSTIVGNVGYNVVLAHFKRPFVNANAFIGSVFE